MLAALAAIGRLNELPLSHSTPLGLPHSKDNPPLQSRRIGISFCALTRPGGRAAAAATTASTAAPSLLPNASEASAVNSTNGASQADLQPDSMHIIVAYDDEIHYACILLPMAAPSMTPR